MRLFPERSHDFPLADENNSDTPCPLLSALQSSLLPQRLLWIGRELKDTGNPALRNPFGISCLWTCSLGRRYEGIWPAWYTVLGMLALLPPIPLMRQSRWGKATVSTVFPVWRRTLASTAGPSHVYLIFQYSSHTNGHNDFLYDPALVIFSWPKTYPATPFVMVKIWGWWE